MKVKFICDCGYEETVDQAEIRNWKLFRCNRCQAAGQCHIQYISDGGVPLSNPFVPKVITEDRERIKELLGDGGLDNTKLRADLKEAVELLRELISEQNEYMCYDYPQLGIPSRTCPSCRMGAKDPDPLEHSDNCIFIRACALIERIEKGK